MSARFTIGEFSRITGLTVKTLRFYHDESVLVAAFVDFQTGYRYYSDAQIETARAIAWLRGMEFSLDQVREILRDNENEERVLDVVERQRAALREKLEHLGSVVRSLDEFLAREKEAATMAQSAVEVGEKRLDPCLIAGIRMKGRYQDCGQAFGRLGRSLGRHINGKPFLLHYDAEYKEDDADFEACMPVGQSVRVEGVSIRELPGGLCAFLLHKGPYERLGDSYARIIAYVNERGYEVVMPTREVYIKGPGMIFKGNPRKYLTEIQIPIKSGPA